MRSHSTLTKVGPTANNFTGNFTRYLMIG
jgi:hypothetical protein